MRYIDNNGRSHRTVAGAVVSNTIEKTKARMQIMPRSRRIQKSSQISVPEDNSTNITDTISPENEVSEAANKHEELDPKEALDDSDVIKSTIESNIEGVSSLPSPENVTGIINAALGSNNDSIRKLADGRDESNVFSDEFIDCAASVINSAIQSDPDTIIKGGEPLMKELFNKLNDKIKDE